MISIQLKIGVVKRRVISCLVAHVIIHDHRWCKNDILPQVFRYSSSVGPTCTFFYACFSPMKDFKSHRERTKTWKKKGGTERRRLQFGSLRSPKLYPTFKYAILFNFRIFLVRRRLRPTISL